MQTTIRRLVRKLAVGLAALAVGMTLSVPAWADDLDDQLSNVSQQLTAAQAQRDADMQSLANASSALEESRVRLEQAAAQLADTHRQLAEAEAEDEAAAVKLAKAQDDLERAKAAVEQGERDVAAQRLEVGNVARSQYQQRTGMVGISMVVTGESTGDVNNRIQWSRTLMDSTQAELEKLEDVLAQLVEAKERQARLEEQIAAERARAAANLATRQALAAQAAEQEQEVAARVAANTAAEAQASESLAASQQQAEQLSVEQSDVERRIQERIARAEAERQRRAEADRQARANAEAAAAAHNAEAATTANAAPARAPRSQTGRSQSSQSSRSGQRPAAAAPTSGFVAPAGGRITSRFGMRLHPVLKVWKLHDGTDYGAACGSPIRAAAAGRVVERYYNAGYGNRLMIDHGRINGSATTTSYNHAIRYTVGVGQRVQRGQVIGYVGNTGYSTGCHLHLMVWVNGKLTNPQTVGF